MYLEYIDQSVDFHSLVEGLTIFLWWCCQYNKNRQNSQKNVALWKEEREVQLQWLNSKNYENLEDIFNAIPG